ncbi:hypothetical protein M413DRAFT_423953 [Hebeloma cylindrosporum]|uniref:Uncharacterized protein n=1 Tax=Hebeloma cylindrosporum TaxID=76867 RepID=A0A0C3BYK5_HEBCY|nr:hypothetical protein M413DRAFT_423953 [Hebeloma cylindrosporum h7]
MLFRPIALLLCSVLFVQAAPAALTPPQVVTNTGVVTSIYGKLNTAVSRLSNAPSIQDAQTVEQRIITDFQTVVADLDNDTNAARTTPPFADNGAALVEKALKKTLMTTLIEKKPVFAEFALTVRIAASLGSLESSLDSFAIALNDLIPTRKAAVSQAKASLDSSAKSARTKYEEFCIPSPLYPTLPPICAGA